mmetsp:Transcript_7447/g.20653  ORF Transcript_7447/g.20653 Transcript_7447/m.20653 type:complete len:417 (-) Transcript_7447:2365-3615(-)
MAKFLRSDSGVELPPFREDKDNSRITSSGSWKDKDGDLSLTISDFDEDDNDADTSMGLGRSRLESENMRLRAELTFMKQRLGQYEALPQAPASKRNARAPSKSPNSDAKEKSPRRTRSSSRRRWSLSSVSSRGSGKGIDQQDLEIGMMLRYQQKSNDEAIVLYHDELDHFVSGRGLHHRRLPGNGLPPLPQGEKIRRNKSDDNFLSHEFRGDDDDEAERLLRNPAAPSVEDLPSLESSFVDDMKDRASWLVGLMILQSLSSFIIKRNEDMLEEHLVIVQFLTMLVGAGGNAGNQASVRVIRGLAVGQVTDNNVLDFLKKEIGMGLLLAIILGISGCVRAFVFSTPLPETMAITMSLWSIVFISVVVGASLPVAMKFCSIDPAHSSTTIQVVMDILGVTITVHISRMVLSFVEGHKH